MGASGRQRLSVAGPGSAVDRSVQFAILQTIWNWTRIVIVRWGFDLWVKRLYSSLPVACSPRLIGFSIDSLVHRLGHWSFINQRVLPLFREVTGYTCFTVMLLPFPGSCHYGFEIQSRKRDLRARLSGYQSFATVPPRDDLLLN